MDAGGEVIYAATVIVSACLLFLVQPLMAKIILPWFGGTSAVWAAALVFFQACLLCGYAYAHWLAGRVEQRWQWLLHSALLAAGCALMPILPADEWRPSGGQNPIAQILLLLAATVGLPALLLGSTSPLLQVWYLRRHGSEIPYWLFALSNAGSLLALLAFPLLLEPAFDTGTLAMAWSAGFVAFAAMCMVAGWQSRSAPLRPSPLPQRDGPPPGGVQMALWMALSACASALLVAVSTQLSTNVTPIPLLWVLPLALYLLTFILNFARPRFYRRAVFFPWVAAALGGMAWLYIDTDDNTHIRHAIPLYLACLFVICTVCHGELVQRSPPARFLTRYYLLIALGGALGGLFVGVLAPLTFDTYLEMPLLLIVIAGLMVVLQWRRKGSGRTLWPVRAAMVAGLATLAICLLLAEATNREQNLLVTRDFYGVLRVRDYVDRKLARRSLINGTIGHGSQFTADPYRDLPGSYYSAHSGIGRALEALRERGPLRFAVVGLGAGVIASYARAGDHWSFYEISPTVVGIAQEYFSFLSRATQRGADIQVLIGDGRLSLQRQQPQRFDMLIVDAFSSDAIPTHLLTREAMELYVRHLKPGGVLAVHISNRYLDLLPVCRRAAEHVGRVATLLRDPADEINDGSDWVLITQHHGLLRHPRFKDANLEHARAPPSFKGWTDQYSSVWPLLRLGKETRPES